MKSLSIFLIIVYQIVAFKPLLTILDFEINRDFIASNLCENKDNPNSSCGGKCYLTKRLKSSFIEPFETNKTPNKQNITEEEELHIDLNQVIKLSSRLFVSRQFFDFYETKIPTQFLEVLSPPPKKQPHFS